MSDPVSQLLVIVGILAVSLVLSVRRTAYWKGRCHEQESAARHWFGRTRE